MNNHTDIEYRRPELMPGETILSQITPKKGPFMIHKFVKNIYPVIYITLIFSAFLLIPALMMSKNGMQILLPQGAAWAPYGIFAILLLIPMVPWVCDVLTMGRCYKHTVYYVTNQRVIIFTGNTYPVEHSISYSDINRVVATPYFGHTKRIFLYDAASLMRSAARYNLSNMFRKHHDLVMDCVEDADRIQSLINRYLVN